MFGGKEQVPKRRRSVGKRSSKRPLYRYSGPSRWGLSVPADPSCSGQVSIQVSHHGFTMAWEKLPTSTDTSDVSQPAPRRSSVQRKKSGRWDRQVSEEHKARTSPDLYLNH